MCVGRSCRRPGSVRPGHALASLFLALALCMGGGGQARAEDLLRLDQCRIVDGRGPVRAMGVNYVDGFWAFTKDGKRDAYLPYLEALAEARIPFIRMAFGP